VRCCALLYRSNSSQRVFSGRILRRLGSKRSRAQNTVQAESGSNAAINSLPSFSSELRGTPGRYVLAVLKMTDDGNVGSATIALTAQ